MGLYDELDQVAIESKFHRLANGMLVYQQGSRQYRVPNLDWQQRIEHRAKRRYNVMAGLSSMGFLLPISYKFLPEKWLVLIAVFFFSVFIISWWMLRKSVVNGLERVQ